MLVQNKEAKIERDDEIKRRGGKEVRHNERLEVKVSKHEDKAMILYTPLFTCLLNISTVL